MHIIIWMESLLPGYPYPGELSMHICIPVIPSRAIHNLHMHNVVSARARVRDMGAIGWHECAGDRATSADHGKVLRSFAR